MNRIYTIMLIILLPFSALYAQESKTIELSLSKEDFTLEYDSIGTLYISSQTLQTFFLEDENLPGLPYLPINVAISKSSSYQNVNLESVNKELFLKNVKLASNPVFEETNTSFLPKKLFDTKDYPKKKYPIENVIFAGKSETSEFDILHFHVCPFEYDAIGKNVYFTNRLSIKILLGTEILRPKKTILRNANKTMINDLKLILSNPEDVDIICNNDKRSLALKSQEAPEPIDYIIITSNKLSSSFAPLVRWKRTKGVKTEVITIESIADSYEGKDLQEKIKNCLYFLYRRNGLKYALLGGDDTIVPVRECYGHQPPPGNGKITVYDLPTDLYYACFD